MPEPVSTEVATRADNAVDVLGDRFPALNPTEEMIELFEDVFGGAPATRDFSRIKFPTAGGASWMVMKDGNETYIKEIVGVPLLTSKQRSFWESTEPDSSPPECASADGKTPLPGGAFAPDGKRAAENPGGTCKTCPKSQWKSSPKNDRGQHCRDQRAVFLMTEGAGLLPTLIIVPPTSITVWDSFLKELLGGSGVSYYKTIMGLSLEEAVSADKKKYSRLKIRVTEKLDDEGAARFLVLREELKKWLAEEPAMTFQDNDDSGINLSTED